MLVSDFDYHLPPELIAQQPLAERAASRLLHLQRAAGAFTDRTFKHLPQLLRAGDLVVFNNTRVFPARLLGHRSGERAQRLSQKNPASRDFLRGRVEVLLLSELSPGVWQALVHPGRRIGVGERLFFGSHGTQPSPGRESDIELQAEVTARGAFGERTLRFAPVPDFFERLERLGHVPLPPYIARPDASADRDRYQTVYACVRGSAAAPTAGLHFTPEILEQIRAQGADTVEITLHIGLGTFQPVRERKVEAHAMPSERYLISEAAAARINAALSARRRIVAVGTTSVRCLEAAATPAERDPASAGVRATTSAPAAGPSLPQLAAGSGEAGIFIYPGFGFRVVGALLTNFHLPQSTLLMLVAAFAGREFTLRAYQHAVDQRYRFYSYGDCMFIE